MNDTATGSKLHAMIVENMADAIITLDQQADITLLNPAALLQRRHLFPERKLGQGYTLPPAHR